MKLEARGEWSTISYPIKFEDDISRILLNNEELVKLISDFNGDLKSSKFSRISALVTHNGRRIQNSDPGSVSSQISAKNEALLQLTNLKSDVEKLVRKFNRSSTDTSIDILNPINNSSSQGSSDSDSEHENVFQSTPVKTSLSNAFKSTPVVKWNLKFSGEQDMSLSAFLERVDELSKARNVDQDELFRSAYDLFSGKALTWFRANIKLAVDWPSLVKLLREEFQPADYDEKLYEEIKARTQGPNETIGIYLAIMDSLFSRLSVTISENRQLKILLSNISPFYQTQLGLTEIKSKSELLRLCRLLETKRTQLEKFEHPPSPSSSNLLEPDLAYVQPCSSTSVSNNDSSCDIVCFNCNQQGHKKLQCPKLKRRNLKCFKCGRENLTVRLCPNCNKGFQKNF